LTVQGGWLAGAQPSPDLRRPEGSRTPRSTAWRILARHEASTRRRFKRVKVELWLAVIHEAVLQADRVAARLRALCTPSELDVLRAELEVALSTPSVRRRCLGWDLETCAEVVGTRRLLAVLDRTGSTAPVVRQIHAP
jgi:hypothetical protein